jgi:outer membrane protein assembly factor BamB
VNASRTVLPFLALPLLGALAAAPGAAAQDGFRGWDKIKDPSFVFDPDRGDFRNYQVGRAPQVRELLEKHERLMAERAIVPALRHLQELLDEHGSSVFQVAGDRYVGAAEWARWLLLTAPADVRAAYDKLAEQNGRLALERALADRDDFALRGLARRWVNARVGQEALLALARRHRERGARRVAAWHARRLLEFTGAPLPGREAEAAAIAAEARAIAALCEGSTSGLLDDPAWGSAPVAVAGGTQTLSALVAAEKRGPPVTPDDVWPTYGGDSSRARSSVAPLRELDLDRSFALPVEHARYEGERSPLFDLHHAPIQPIRLGDRLYVNNTLSVKCFDLLSRAQLWEFEGVQARVRNRGDDGFLTVADYNPNNEYDDPTWSKALVVGLSAGGGVVIANLQVPQASNVKMHQGFRINDPCRGRGMVALDAEDGALLWEQRPIRPHPVSGKLEYPTLRRRGDPDGVVPRLDVPAPPAIVDDVVFAIGHFFEGAINTYLVALDLRGGDPLWAVPLVIGQQELSMFNMPFQEFTTGCPSFWNGTVFCPTNVGLVAAVDATFGDLRWLSTYDALKIEPPDNYFRNRPRPVYWYNRGPLVGEDLLLVTPHDSMKLLSFDPSTGRERFSLDLRRRDVWTHPSSHLIGQLQGHAIVATSGSVVAIDLKDGLVKWQYPSAPRSGGRPIELLGSGAVTDRRIYLPTAEELVVLEDQGSRAIELDRRPWEASDAEEPRSLLVFPDMLVAAGKSSVLVAFDPAEALRELRGEAAAKGENVELLARIGSLERQAGDLAPAAATLRRALELARSRATPPGDLARVRASLCGALREIAETESRAGRSAPAELALVEAESVADDAETRAAIVRELLDRFAPDAKDERALAWLARLRDDFAGERVTVPELSPRPVTAAIWVGLELARRRERRGELDLALAELQRVQADWPAEPLAERDSVAVAHDAVEALLGRGPPALRERYDRDAKTAFEAAVVAGDVERLALLLRRFPGAASAPEYVARELEMLRRNRRPIEALLIGAEILRSRPGDSLVRAATLELARAARDVGNEPLARALVKRLGAEPEGGTPEDLRPLAETPAEPASAGSQLEPAQTLSLPENTALLGGVERPLRGEPLPSGLQSLLLLQTGAEYEVARLHLPDGEKRWSNVLPRPRQGEFILQCIHVAGALVVRRGSLLIAYDVDSGKELWRKELERDVVELAATSGVLLCTLETPLREGNEGEPVELAFVEPRTGQRLATVALAGTDTQPGRLLATGASCVVTTSGRRGHMAEVFDALTGARQLDPRGYPGAGAPLLLPQAGLLVLPDSRPSPGELASRQGGVQRVNAFRLGSGEKAFDVDLLPLSYKLSYLYAVAEGFAAQGGTPPNAAILVVDPRAGAPIGPPTPLPKELTSLPARALVLGEEQTVKVQGFSDYHKGEPLLFVLLAGNGSELWRRAFEVPKNTVKVQPPNRLVRHGGSLVLALQTEAGGKCRTEVIVLDEANGSVLDRRGFESGRLNTRDDLVRADDWIVLRQERALHVLGWR